MTVNPFEEIERTTTLTERTTEWILSKNRRFAGEGTRDLNPIRKRAYFSQLAAEQASGSCLKSLPWGSKILRSLLRSAQPEYFFSLASHRECLPPATS
jgi:hypothetical protein